MAKTKPEDLPTLIEEAVIRALGRGVDVSRIPFICDDIRGIRADLKEMREEQKTNYKALESFPIVKNIVFGFVSIILVAVIGVAGTVMLTVLSTPH